MALKSGSVTSSDRPPQRWPQPRSAYIHVPFCRHRCGYCSFSVVAGRDDLIERFLSALDSELAPLQSPAVETIYIGGGTPTHLNLDQLDRLLAMIGRRFVLDDCVEWSVEANPEDITPAKLDLLAARGVNRISIGVQSFDNRKLQLLERGHSGESVQSTIERASAAVGNVSIDLIFASPGETLQGWRSDLDAALSLPIQHLSTYSLTYEKGTSYWSRRKRGELHSLDEALEVEMYQLARSLTDRSGLGQYEISNFARSGYRCRHNLAYWEGSGWYGAGPGAARFVDGARQLNHRSTSTYLRRIESGQEPTAESERLSPEDYARERAAFGMRMIDGIDPKEISLATGIDLIGLCGEAIDQSIKEGLVQRQESRLRLTERGILLADTVASRLLFPQD
jgi:oxygen-independent coproporphyrinogen-3 oxidase